jgi:hypothetical protein
MEPTSGANAPQSSLGFDEPIVRVVVIEHGNPVYPREEFDSSIEGLKSVSK